MTAYLGKILWVDLAAHQCREEHIPDDIYAQYLSGIGLAANLLYERIPALADPLGPDNVLAFVSGLLTGTPSSYTGRWMAAAKSPLTNTWGEANCGGYFGMAIKQTGYDGIFFSGVSPSPVYLYLGAGAPELRDASNLWGLDTVQTEDRLAEIHKDKKRIAVACIGPAGESQSLISGISHDRGRLAARSGLGAVMGSKRLKALVLQRSGRISAANPERMRQLNAEVRKTARINLPLPGWIFPFFGKLLRNPLFNVRLDGVLINSVLKKWGSSGMFQALTEWDDAPIKNWLGSHRDYPTKRARFFSPAKIEQAELRKYHCYACPTGCGGIFRMPNGDGEVHKPEYETVNAFSALLLTDDFDSLLRINDLLNRAGMDSISAGATAAAAVEWFEEGLISAEQTGGLQLCWGNTEAVEALVRQMTQREGFGALLADGVRAAQQILNIRSSPAAVHAGGQEMAMHDPRLDAGYALHASVEPNPGRHTTGSFMNYDLYRLWTAIPQLPKPELLSLKKRNNGFELSDGIKGAANSCYTNFYNGLGFCYYGAFLGVDRLHLFELVDAATGWQHTPREYLQIGQRILTLKQLFNLKQGIEPVSIKPSRRALGLPPLKVGGNKSVSVDLETLRRFYWQIIGYDPNNGIPTPETLQELGLTALAEPLNLPASVLTTAEAEQENIQVPRLNDTD